MSDQADLLTERLTAGIKETQQRLQELANQENPLVGGVDLSALAAMPAVVGSVRFLSAIRLLHAFIYKEHVALIRHILSDKDVNIPEIVKALDNEVDEYIQHCTVQEIELVLNRRIPMIQEWLNDNFISSVQAKWKPELSLFGEKLGPGDTRIYCVKNEEQRKALCEALRVAIRKQQPDQPPLVFGYDPTPYTLMPDLWLPDVGRPGGTKAQTITQRLLSQGYPLLLAENVNDMFAVSKGSARKVQAIADAVTKSRADNSKWFLFLGVAVVEDKKLTQTKMLRPVEYAHAHTADLVETVGFVWGKETLEP